MHSRCFLDRAVELKQSQKLMAKNTENPAAHAARAPPAAVPPTSAPSPSAAHDAFVTLLKKDYLDACVLHSIPSEPIERRYNMDSLREAIHRKLVVDNLTTDLGQVAVDPSPSPAAPDEMRH
jgi:hypothetical protein